MFSSTSTLINNSGHDHQDTENQGQTLMLQQQYHSSPFLFFHHDPFLDQENDFLATHDHQDPHQFLPQNQHHHHQQQQQQEILLGSCNGNNGGDQGSQEVINPAAARSSSSKGGRTSSNSNNKKKRSISDHGDGAKQPSQRRRSGKKDRHSKIYTAQGPRDRRMRLSLQIARKFFDLQDILGFDKASKTIEWLFTKSKAAIKELTDSVPGVKRTTIRCSNGGKSITTVLSCTSESEVASSSAIKLPGQSTRSPNNHKDKIRKGKKRLRKLPVFNPDGRDKARARARERTKEKMKNMVKGCSSPPNPSCSNLEQEIMPTTGGGGDEGRELQEGECSTDLLQQEMDFVNLTDHCSKSNLGDVVTSNNSSSFFDFSQHQHDFEEEEEYFSWYPVNLDSMISTMPQAAGNNIVHHMQYPFASFINVSPFAQQQRTSSLNLATTSSIDQGQNKVSTTTTIFASQESENPSSSVTLNFSNLSHDHHHQINTNTDSGNLKSQLLDSYHLSCNPSYKFGSLF